MTIKMRLTLIATRFGRFTITDTVVVFLYILYYILEVYVLSMKMWLCVYYECIYN